MSVARTICWWKDTTGFTVWCRAASLCWRDSTRRISARRWGSSPNTSTRRRVSPKDFEQLAQEAGLGKALVRRRVAELAGTVSDALGGANVDHPVAARVADLIRARSEKARGRLAGEKS